jgi:hypothetical protein
MDGPDTQGAVGIQAGQNYADGRSFKFARDGFEEEVDGWLWKMGHGRRQ